MMYTFTHSLIHTDVITERRDIMACRDRNLLLSGVSFAGTYPISCGISTNTRY